MYMNRYIYIYIYIYEYIYIYDIRTSYSLCVIGLPAFHFPWSGERGPRHPLQSASKLSLRFEVHLTDWIWLDGSILDYINVYIDDWIYIITPPGRIGWFDIWWLFDWISWMSDVYNVWLVDGLMGWMDVWGVDELLQVRRLESARNDWAFVLASEAVEDFSGGFLVEIWWNFDGICGESYTNIERTCNGLADCNRVKAIWRK